MLRISQVELAKGSATLRLEGRVVKGLAEEVRLACEEYLGKGYRLTLDLCDLSFADRDAIAILAKLRQHKVEFTNCSPFIAEQLKEKASENG